MKPQGAWEQKSLGDTGIHVTVPVTNQTFAENSSSGNQQINHVGKIQSCLWFETFNVPFYSINFPRFLRLSI
jgi:hypothetical protein